MDSSTKANSKSGLWITTLEGYKAFHPNPLPPEIEWTPGLASALADASLLIGKLAGEGRRLNNPHALIRSFVRREAVLSSRIEGTQATLGELLAAEAGAVVERSPDDLREVANYVVALEFGLERLKDLPLSLRLVREVHHRLMDGVRGRQAASGEFRRTQNWIGLPGATLNEASYVPPPMDAMLDHLGAWERFLHNRSLPPLVHAAMMHYQFEAIHPFPDGNGRVGRLLISLLLCEREVLPSPLLYLSAFFEATRLRYYEALRRVTEEGDWDGWLRYFLNGVARQAEDAISRAERLNQLFESWRSAILSQSGSKAAARLLDLLFANPFVTPKGTSSKLGVSYNTAIRAITQLQALGIVQATSAVTRRRVYCARDILDILEEPARLTPVGMPAVSNFNSP